MLKVLINGCNGKMGQVVAEEIAITPDVETLCGFDRVDTGDNNFPVFTNIEDINLIPDVIIDFSIPVATFTILEFAKKHNIPTVIATTGFSDEENNKIQELSKEFPIFKSSNMSYEINLMAKLVADLAKKLSDSDIEIVETHHNRKIDSPSGTALILADSINNALDNQMNYEYARHEKREKKKKKEIGIHSIRGGNIVGEHEVIFAGNDEIVKLSHSARSKAIFAQGAVNAAIFLNGKSPRIYNMKDLVNS